MEQSGYRPHQGRNKKTADKKLQSSNEVGTRKLEDEVNERMVYGKYKINTGGSMDGKKPFQDPRFIQELISTLKDQVGLNVMDCEEIAPGLVTILSQAGSYSIYFDKKRWLYGKIKIRNIDANPTIGMIPGYKKESELQSFAEARTFAGRHLKKKPES